jgi:predicted dehydrogenase
MSMRLRIGVIGLGRRWQKYLPALSGLRRHMEVCGVCDEVARVAQRTAQRIGCTAAAGPIDLLERDDIHAVLLLDWQWFGLWPLMRAALLGKPVFCDLSLLREPQADAVHKQVVASGLRVMMATSTLLAPAVLRLRHLLVHQLGPMRLLRIDRSLRRLPRGRSPEGGDRILGSEVMLDMLQLACTLFREQPTCIWTVEASHSPLLSMLMEFGPDRVAQLNLWIDPTSPPVSRVRAVAEHGQAEVTFPRLLQWRDSEGAHRQQWRRHPMRQTLLQRFALTIQGGQPMQPSFQEAYQALVWWRTALQSEAEGRRVFLNPEANLDG